VEKSEEYKGSTDKKERESSAPTKVGGGCRDLRLHRPYPGLSMSGQISFGQRVIGGDLIRQVIMARHKKGESRYKLAEKFP